MAGKFAVLISLDVGTEELALQVKRETEFGFESVLDILWKFGHSILLTIVNYNNRLNFPKLLALDVCDTEGHCRDSSDENINFCSGNFTELTKNLYSECAAGMFRCRFGGCIDSRHLCDGAIDCYDGNAARMT
jgi:hypothetical protein